MKTHILRSLSGEPFRYLWLSELFTQIAVNVFNFFLIIVAFANTRSNTAVSGVVLSFTIPAIIFGSFAGAYVDRMNKKKVLIVSNVAQAGLLIILIFFFKKCLYGLSDLLCLCDITPIFYSGRNAADTAHC